MNIIAKTTNQEITSPLNYNEEVIKKYALDYLANNSSVSKLTEQQKNEFLSTCVVNGLNPFKREAHVICFGGKFSIITGYEVYLKRAAASGLLNGYTVDYEKNEQHGSIAVITIHRKGWNYPIVHKVSLKEYKQNSPIWNEKPLTMLTKVAISQGFRRAFPDVIDGLPYTKEELDEPVIVNNTEANESGETKVIKNKASSKVTNANLEDVEELFE